MDSQIFGDDANASGKSCHDNLRVLLVILFNSCTCIKRIFTYHNCFKSKAVTLKCSQLITLFLFGSFGVCADEPM